MVECSDLLGPLAHGLLSLRREIVCFTLCEGVEQVDGLVIFQVVVNDSGPATFALARQSNASFADSATLSHRAAFLWILSKFSLEISVIFVADQILDDAGKDE